MRLLMINNQVPPSAVKTKARHVMRLGEMGLSKLKNGVLRNTPRPPLPAGPPPPAACKSPEKIGPQQQEQVSQVVEEEENLSAAEVDESSALRPIIQPVKHTTLVIQSIDPMLLHPEPGIASPQTKSKYCALNVLDDEALEQPSSSCCSFESESDTGSDAGSDSLSIVLDVEALGTGEEMVRVSLWQGACLLKEKEDEEEERQERNKRDDKVGHAYILCELENDLEKQNGSDILDQPIPDHDDSRLVTAKAFQYQGQQQQKRPVTPVPEKLDASVALLDVSHLDSTLLEGVLERSFNRYFAGDSSRIENILEKSISGAVDRLMDRMGDSLMQKLEEKILFKIEERFKNHLSRS